jgi:gliding motility-associated protein GldM
MSVLSSIGHRPVLLCILLLLITSLSACTEKSEREMAVLYEADKSIMLSSGIINKSTKTLLAEMEENFSDLYYVSEREKYWTPKAKRIEELSDEMLYYIENLKSDLKEEAGAKGDGNNEVYNKSNKEPVIHLFLHREKGKELSDKLAQYRKSVLSIDIGLDSAFNDVIGFANSTDDSLLSGRSTFYKIYFEGITTMAAVCLLTRLQGEIVGIENSMIKYCFERSKPGCNLPFDSYSAIVGQSSSVVKPGEQIEITAGIGSFSKAALPTISFNNKIVPIDQAGTSVYKFRAPVGPGKYTMPVKIAFTDQDGKAQVMTKEVEYTVVKESN